MTSQIQTTRLDSANKNSPSQENNGANAERGNLDLVIDNLIKDLDQAITGDISGELKREDTKALHQPITNEKSSNTLVDKSKINFFERFLHDDWGVRTWFALGNEIAESSKHLLGNLLPKPIFSIVYKALWSLAIIATGSRVATNTMKAKPEEKIKAGAKMLVHDGIAAIGVPTIVANVMNTIQHKIYDTLRLPTFIRDLLTTIGSLWTCKIVIHKLDPHAAKLGATLTKLTNDRHKEINDALGRGH